MVGRRIHADKICKLLIVGRKLDFARHRLDEHMVRAYIRNQEVEDERYEQMKLGAD